jgi:diguanylate cyclase (GGDEF)-like protein/PAS domain S-box-containing protein
MQTSITGIKNKILLMLLILIVLFIGLFSSLVIAELRSDLRKKTVQANKALVGVFESRTKRMASFYFAVIDEILERPGVMEAIEAGDRAKLYNLVLDKYEFMQKENPQMEILHFHTKDNHSFLRMNWPDKYGDSLGAFRKIIVDVNSSLRPISGFELGKSGLFFRTVKPVIDSKGRHYGSIEVGLKPEYFYYVVKESMPDLLPYISVLEGQLNAYDADSSERQETLSEGETVQNLINLSKDSGHEYLSYNGRRYSVCQGTVFNDYKGAGVAELKAFFDVTEDFNDIYSKEFAMLLLALVLVLLVYLILNRGFLKYSLHYDLKNAELNSLYKLFASGSTVIFKWHNNLNWDVAFVTPNVSDLFGYSTNEFYDGRAKYAALINKEDIGRIAGEVNAALKKGVEHFTHKPYRIIAKNGSVRWVYDTTRIIRNEKGEATFLHGYVTDITEFYVIQENQRKFNERNTLAIEASGDGLWDWNVLTGEVYYSPRWIAMLGYDEHEIKGTIQSWKDLVHSDDRERTEKEVGRMLSGESEHYECVYRILCRGGSYKWILDRGKAYFSEDGRAVRALGFLTDITEKKNIELKLEDSRKFLEVLLSDLPVPVFYKDSNLRFIGCNDRFLEFIGASSRNEIVGHLESDLFDKAQSEVHQNYGRLALEDTGRMHEYEVDFTTLKGNRRKIIVYKRAYKNNEGETCGIIGAIADVTEMKSLQRMLMTNAEEVHRAKKDLDDAQSIAKIGSWRWEIGSGRLVWSDELYRILGIAVGSVLPTFELLMEFIHKDDRERAMKEIYMAIEIIRAFSIEYKIATPNGETKYVHIRGDVILDGRAVPVAMIGTVQDITDITNAQKALNNLNRRLSEYTDIVDRNVVVSRTDKYGSIVYVSDAFCVLSGYTRGELIGQNHRILSHPDMDRKVYEDLWKTITSGSVWSGELHNRSREGKDYWLFVRISPTYGKTGEINGYTAISTDISVKKEMETLSVTDPLTKLYNRLKLDETLQQELDRCRRYDCELAVLLIDVDGFKAVNDTYGHQRGDQILKKISGVLSENIRKTDTVGRWGGEEFLVVCPETDIEGGRVMAEKLRKAVELIKDEKSGIVTCSFGVSSFIKGCDENTLIKSADRALYAAKEAGRNRVALQICVID